MNHELRHWLKKGEAAEDHKYVKREMRNGKWRYWYKPPTVKKTPDVKVNKTLNVSKVNSWIKSGKDSLGKLADKTSNVVESAKKNVQKFAAKISTASAETKQMFTDKAYKSYAKGKDVVDKAIDKKVSELTSNKEKLSAGYYRAITKIDSVGSAAFNFASAAFCAVQAAIDTPKSFSELKRITTPQSNADHQEAINPKYGLGFLYDYSYNCTFCTAAYDLRKRGYDVEANPISMPEAYTLDSICSWYKGADPVYEQNIKGRTTSVISSEEYSKNRAKILNNSLESHGDGARGHLCLEWSNGGGHDIAWEIENGKVVYRDCQSNMLINIGDTLEYTTTYQYLRTDNLEMTEDILRAVRNRKDR